MSLVTVAEAKNLRHGFDVEGIVKSMSCPKFVNLKNGDVARVSNAYLSDGNGHQIKIEFWNDDIKKVRNNLKIKITNAYTKTFRGDTILYKSRSGLIEILNFNPNEIFNDIERFQKYNRDIKSFYDYYNFVKNTNSDLYLGTKKSNYLLIIKAFIVIENARKRKAKQCKHESSAICYLHQTITLSAAGIQEILELFNIHLNYERILKISNRWTKDKSENQPQITHKVTKKIDERDGDEIYNFEITTDEIPDEISIDENPEILDPKKPLCESSPLEFDRKYKA